MAGTREKQFSLLSEIKSKMIQLNDRRSTQLHRLTGPARQINCSRMKISRNVTIELRFILIANLPHGLMDEFIEINSELIAWKSVYGCLFFPPSSWRLA